MLAALALAAATVAAPPRVSPMALDQESDFAALDRAAIDAYRAGDHATAAALWIDALPLAHLGAERGRICYDLGNTAYRRDELLAAVGWYTAALRHAPRDPDLWANLELARAEAELEPADRGDLSATVVRLLSSLTRGEAEWLLMGAFAILGAALAGEALRGGRVWRRLALVAVVGVLIAGAPLGWQLAQAGGHPMLVVDGGGARSRSEPRSDAQGLGRLQAGSVVQRRDALPGWVKVAQGGREVWVRERAVFDLVR